ncbi:hypothetical protein [Pandoraea sp. NPDC087047]|uniref:hypothetical protein n=1 Tax=Pandoraea sp. NPDC087047 TaxID=3364390 RepID=UPI00380774AD
MIVCRRTRELKDDGAWELEYRERKQKPVIVILDPRRVFEAIEQDFKPNPERLCDVLQIPDTLDFSLPWVQDGDPIFFQQGRHRTAALAKLGFHAYPVVTRDEDAQALIRKFGAPIAEARKHFDWAKLTEYPTIDRVVTEAQARASGFTREIIATSLGSDLHLLIQPHVELDREFEAFDRNAHEVICVNGWLGTFEDI